MRKTTVQAPVSFLLDPHLTPAAKVLWLASLVQPDHATPATLAALAGLSLPTVHKNMAILGCRTIPATPCVSIPADLLAERRTRPRTKLLYGILQTLPGFRENCGAFTFASLSEAADTSMPTTRELVAELTETGWLQATQAHKFAPIQFRLRIPDVDRQRAETERARRRLEEAEYRGEAIMREYLSLLIYSDEYEDNARPGFLINPLTSERLELDRYYPPTAAFEFNGPQHYRTTERFPSEQALLMRQARDLMKEALCARRGIRVIVVDPADLNLRTMQQKVATLLPLRDLRGHEALIQLLEKVSGSYRG